MPGLRQSQLEDSLLYVIVYGTGSDPGAFLCSDDFWGEPWRKTRMPLNLCAEDLNKDLLA